MSELTFLDGGMGTLLQAKGLKPGEAPEDWNVERPEAVTEIHRAYVDAGADVVYANTFGANPLKYRGRHALGEVVRAGLRCAACAAQAGRTKRRVALDIGPTGRLLKPAGDLSFEAAVAAFSETIRLATQSVNQSISQSVNPNTLSIEQSEQSNNPNNPNNRTIKQSEQSNNPNNPNNRTIKQSEQSNNPNNPNNRTIKQSPLPDLIVIETMSDVRELKAAVIAAKETCDLPVYATVTLGADGKLLTGGSVESVAALLESLGVDAYGFNCGLGPDQMLPYVERLAKVSTKPIIVKPNAGLPKVVDGQTVFSVGPEAFAASVAKLVAAGASIVGGCCGTTPRHVGELFRLFDCSDCSIVRLRDYSGESPNHPIEQSEQSEQSNNITNISSATSVVELRPHAGLVIGERINPTGKKALKEAYAKGDTAYVLREAVKQVDAGAAVLDVNCGVPGLDEASLLEATVEAVQGVATCPLQIDTADPRALERGLRAANGKPLVNSVNGKRESMDAVFPLVKKYGGTIVALCLDESGIPATSEGRLAIARCILEEGAKYGFEKKDFVFDALTLAVSSDASAAVVTLETVRRLTEELGVNTVLGVSNVSFGLPNRPALNNAMYALAKRAGLSAAIANPAAIRDEIDPAAEDVLMGRDPNCAKWIAAAAQGEGGRETLDARRGEGTRDARRETQELFAAIRRGLKGDAKAAAAAALAAGRPPMEIIEAAIVPALEEVGRGFEKGTVYLPQLLMAADAAGEAFAVVRNDLSSTSAGRLPNSQSSNSNNRTILPSFSRR